MTTATSTMNLLEQVEFVTETWDRLAAQGHPGRTVLRVAAALAKEPRWVSGASPAMVARYRHVARLLRESRDINVARDVLLRAKSIGAALQDLKTPSADPGPISGRVLRVGDLLEHLRKVPTRMSRALVQCFEECPSGACPNLEAVFTGYDSEERRALCMFALEQRHLTLFSFDVGFERQKSKAFFSLIKHLAVSLGMKLTSFKRRPAFMPKSRAHSPGVWAFGEITQQQAADFLELDISRLSLTTKLSLGFRPTSDPVAPAADIKPIEDPILLAPRGAPSASVSPAGLAPDTASVFQRIENDGQRFVAAQKLSYLLNVIRAGAPEALWPSIDSASSFVSLLAVV